MKVLLLASLLVSQVVFAASPISFDPQNGGESVAPQVAVFSSAETSRESDISDRPAKRTRREAVQSAKQALNSKFAQFSPDSTRNSIPWKRLDVQGWPASVRSYHQKYWKKADIEAINKAIPEMAFRWKPQAEEITREITSEAASENPYGITSSILDELPFETARGILNEIPCEVTREVEQQHSSSSSSNETAVKKELDDGLMIFWDPEDFDKALQEFEENLGYLVSDIRAPF